RGKHCRDAGTEQAAIIKDGHAKVVALVRFDDPIAVTLGEGDCIGHVSEPGHATETLIQGRGVPVCDRNGKRSDRVTVVGGIDDRGRVRPRRQVHRISAVWFGRGGETRGGAACYLDQGVLERYTRIAGGDGSTECALVRRNRIGKLEGAYLRLP